MVTIPLFLVDIDLTRPLVWNGSSLELSSVTYDEINTRISNLKKNRLHLSTNIQKVRLDLGQIRKFDLFDLESEVRLLEKQVLKLIPLISYAENTQTNLSVRTDRYKELLTLISELYDKFKGVGDPILAEIESNSGRIAIFKRKIAILTPIVESINSKSDQLDSKLYRIDSTARKLISDLSDIYNDINMITDNNFQLSKVQAEIENSQTIIDAKSKQNQTNVEYLASRVCDLNIKFQTLYVELTSVIQDMNDIFWTADYLGKTADTAQLGLNKLTDSISILRDFYVTADAKVRAIESYLTSFIIGGDNIHLDFGLDYTIVHAIPPKAPLCPDPDPCPKSLTPIIVTASPGSPTTTTAPGTGTGTGGSGTTTPKPSATSAPGATTTAPPTTTTKAPPRKTSCFASDSDYLGCFVVYAVVQVNDSNENYVQAVLREIVFENLEVVDIQCYWDTDSKTEAEVDAKTTAKIWNTNKKTYENTIYDFKVSEVTSNSRCRAMDRTDRYE